MRPVSLLLLTSVVLLGAGCFKTPAPTVLPDQPEHVSENMVGDFALTSQEINKEFVLNDYAECKVHISYPVFPTDTLPEIIRLQAEHEMSHFIAAALDYSGEVDGYAELEALADDYMTQCQSDIETEYNDLKNNGEDLFTNLKRNIEIVYAVKLNQAPYLSVGLEQNAYTGGAHPNQSMLYLNLKADTDHLLSLSDIIKPDQLKTFSQNEKAQLLADNRDNLYPDVADEYDQLIEDKSAMTPEQQLATFGQAENFFLTPTALVTYYNSYDIAPYAAGPIYVEIPFSTLEDSLLVQLP